MEQLVIDVSSNEDAHLIKELLKRFKNVEVNSFNSNISEKEIKVYLYLCRQILGQ